MKKVLILVAVFMLTLTLAACGSECPECEELEAIPADLMLDDENFDDFLGRPDVQYVDLRDFDDKLNSGYVAGFEMIPFFNYLEYAGIMDREGNVANEAQVRNLFNEDAEAIFLMCGSGTRAGWVLDALEGLGYTNAINVGGITAYAGDAKVLGDSTFVLEHPQSGEFTPGTYFAVDPTTQYTATIVVGEGGAIEDVVFDAMYHGTTKNTLDTGYTLASGKTWKEEADALAAYVLANQGWGDIELTVEDLTGLDYYSVPHHGIYIDTANSPDDVAGVSIGAEGFVLAWNLAIAQAGGTPIADVFTSQEWADAHNSPYDLVDGVYFGDSEGGYTARITVENNMIVDVYFDAVYTRYTTVINYDVPFTNDNGTPDDDTDDFADVRDEVAVTYSTYSTKQALGEGYTLASGITWAAEADELADAIVSLGYWNPSWVIIPGVDGGHDKFDMTDTDTEDAVGGVTIGIEGFVEAFEEALAKAEPTT